MNSPIFSRLHEIRESSYFQWFTFALFHGCAALLIAAGCDRPQQGNAADNKPGPASVQQVEVAEVVLADMDHTADVPVTIEGFEMTSIVSRIEGYVGQVYVDIGSEVRGPAYDAEGNVTDEGQPLIVLDVPELPAEVERRQALLHKAEAQVESVKAEVAQAQAQLAEHEAMKKLRAAELSVMTSLVQRGAQDRAKQDEAQFAYEAVLAAIQSSGADIAAVEARVKAADAEVEVTRAELAKAEALSNYTTIRAPYDAAVTWRNVHPGALVRPATSGDEPLLELERADKLRVVAFIDIDDAPHVDTGDKAVLHNLEGLPGLRVADLQVSRYAKALHRGSRMMRVEIDLQNPADPATGKRTFRPGDYGQIALTLEKHSGIASVPFDALAEDDEGTYVVVVDSFGVCHVRPVQVKVRRSTQVGIVGRETAIRAGDNVIVKEVEKYKDGQKIPPGAIKKRTL